MGVLEQLADRRGYIGDLLPPQHIHRPGSGSELYHKSIHTASAMLDDMTPEHFGQQHRYGIPDLPCLGVQ